MPEPSTEESDPLGLVGSLIDERYEVRKLIGRGGMGYVYEAEHVRIQRLVAIKVLSHLGARARFEREALTTAKIDHPNSVRLTDFGQLADGTLFLVMELLDGAPLSHIIAQGPLEPRRALELTRDVLSALGHAHAQGVVHRDIKPENIIVCESTDGESAKVLDFGIAKLVGDAAVSGPEDNLTEVGMAIGTPTYMSPEQGFATDIDGRSDLYSTAVVLFEMLTGAPPFKADEPIDTVRLHISEPPPTLAARAPSLRGQDELERLVADGLKKKAKFRIASAGEFIERIDTLVADNRLTRPAFAPKPAPEPVTTTPSIELAISRSSTAPLAASAVATISSEKPSTRDRTLAAALRFWPLWVLIAIVIAVFAFSSSNAGIEDPVTWLPNVAAKPELVETPAALEAAALLASGNGKEAIARLEADEALTSDATAQLVLGHALISERKAAAALEAYARATTLDARAAADSTLQENLRSQVESRRRKTRNAALELIIKLARKNTSGPAAEALASVASSHPVRDTRWSAQKVADELDLDGLDRYVMFTLDLRQGKTCKDRKSAVAKLRALGDPRAIGALRKAQRRMSGGFIGLGSRNINSCLRNDAKEAAAYLEEQ